MPDATERKVLAASAFIAALMLFPLGGRITQAKQLLERVSALSALALAALLFAYHLWASRREAEAEVTPPPTTEAAAQPTADAAPPPTTEAAPQPTADAAPQPIAAAQPADAPAPSSNGSRP